MLHWYASSCAGFVLTGRFRPVCSIVYEFPDCWARRAFMDDMNRRFDEPRHCGRIYDTWLIAGLLRGPTS